MIQYNFLNFKQQLKYDLNIRDLHHNNSDQNDLCQDEEAILCLWSEHNQ